MMFIMMICVNMCMNIEVFSNLLHDCYKLSCLIFNDLLIIIMSMMTIIVTLMMTIHSLFNYKAQIIILSNTEFIIVD